MARGKKTGGRKAGTPNKATADVKELAQAHGPAAITELARLAGAAESEQARVAACREILDRAYGKATQVTEITGKDGGPIETAEVNETERARRIAFVLQQGLCKPTIQ
jgi:hypothetical protein